MTEEEKQILLKYLKYKQLTTDDIIKEMKEFIKFMEGQDE